MNSNASPPTQHPPGKKRPPAVSLEASTEWGGARKERVQRWLLLRQVLLVLVLVLLVLLLRVLLLRLQ